MTKQEFLNEFKEVTRVFEKTLNEEYLNILFRKMESVSVPEFRAMKERVFEECEHFPKLAKWVYLANWAKDKRERGPVQDAPVYNCKLCASTGYVRVNVSGINVLTRCDCEWDKGVDEIEKFTDLSNPQVVPWALSEFRPSASADYNDRVQWFCELVNIAKQFWASRVVYP